MLLKILKILAIISYCFIFLPGEHLGGFLFIFLILGYTGDSAIYFLVTILISFALLFLAISAIVPISKSNRSFITIVFLVLIVPIVIVDFNMFYKEPFQYSFGLFLLLAAAVIFLTFKEKKATKNI